MLDGEQRAALAVVRSLGRAGYPVHVCSVARRSLAGGSRYALGESLVPSPLQDADGFARAVAALLARIGSTILLPVTEASALAILERRDAFAGVTIPLPSLDRFRAICDKEAVLREAEKIGFSVPRQQVLSEADSLSRALEGLSFPLAIKPARSVVDGGAARRVTGVQYARSHDEAAGVIANTSPAAFPVLLQEIIDGPGVGVFLLCWEGKTRAVFGHRRIREKPPSGGVSVYRESISVPPSLLDLCTRLLAAFDWEGVAMIELKMDRDTGRVCLMEINGRFWGSLQLAVDAGVDFPRLLLACATRACEPPVREYRLGVRSRWWWGDVDQLLTRLRPFRPDRFLPPSASSRLRAVLDFLVLWRPGDHNEILRLNDPMPFFRETRDWLRGR